MARVRWLLEHGEGLLKAQEAVELRAVLLQDFADSAAGQLAVQEEIDQFLQSGRVSGNNITRLERRIQRRTGTSSSARGDNDSIPGISNFSIGARSRTATPNSARGATSPAPFQMLSLSEDVGKLGVSTWSGIARHRKLLEETEKQRKKDAARASQAEVRKDLIDQMELRKFQQSQERDDLSKVLDHQKADLARYAAAENAKKGDLNQKLFEVNRERDIQMAETAVARERERCLRNEEDDRLIKKVVKEMKREKEKPLNKKIKANEELCRATQEWAKEALEKRKGKGLRMEEERRRVAQYTEMLDTEHQRNRQRINPTLTPRPVSQQTRRGMEVYSEQNIMRQYRENVRRTDEAEERKEKELRSQKQNNRDFLLQQIEEVDSVRKDMNREKRQMLLKLQAEADAHVEAGKKQSEDKSLKNATYRRDLQEQIEARRSAPKDSADVMTAAEISMNRELLAEAAQLRRELGMN